MADAQINPRPRPANVLASLFPCGFGPGPEDGGFESGRTLVRDRVVHLRRNKTQPEFLRRDLRNKTTYIYRSGLPKWEGMLIMNWGGMSKQIGSVLVSASDGAKKKKVTGQGKSKE